MTNNAITLDSKARNLAAHYLQTEGELLSLLIEMRKKKVFVELNYTGIFDYCERALKLSRAQAYYFKSVAEKSEEVPEIKIAVLQGELTLSQARRIVPVITKENQTQWIKKAKALSQRELEREVTSVNPKSHIQEKIRPIAREVSELKVAINQKTEENLEALKDILSQKLGRAATLAEIIAWAVDITREKFDPIRKAQRTVSSGKNSMLVSSKNIPSLKTIQTTKTRHRVLAFVKHSVILRDGMRCTFVGKDNLRCNEKRWLDLHHLVEVAKGGQNTINNLRLLCRAHHRFIHTK